MAKLTGALFSLSASGTIAETITYAKWKGIPFARQRVIPANPQSAEQTSTRTVFTFVGDVYKRMPAIGREPWQAAVSGRPLTAQNLIASKNISNLRPEIDSALFDFSPGALGGLPPVDITLTAGNDQITIACNAPTPPAGWTLTAMQATALVNQDPHLILAEPPHCVEDLTAPYSVVMSGLSSVTEYVVGVWLKWLTSTGQVAYSVATSGVETTT